MKTRLSLCLDNNKNCPEVEIDREERTVAIIDDNGARVTLSERQWQKAKKIVRFSKKTNR